MCLVKYYVLFVDDEKWKLEFEVYCFVVNCDLKYMNFVEFCNYKVIYRCYVGLFFLLCVDLNDNELMYLELIYLFVEMLDYFFVNVCEFDLVFNF